MSELKKRSYDFIKTQHVLYNDNGLSYLHFHMSLPTQFLYSAVYNPQTWGQIHLYLKVFN